MKIAIVGGGISGPMSAHLLHRRHEITHLEARGHNEKTHPDSNPTIVVGRLPTQ